MFGTAFCQYSTIYIFYTYLVVVVDVELHASMALLLGEVVPLQFAKPASSSNGVRPACPHAEDGGTVAQPASGTASYPGHILSFAHTGVSCCVGKHESHSSAAPAPGNNSSPEYGGTSKSEAHMTPAGGSGRNSSLSGGGGLVVVSTAHDRCPRPPPTTELVELRTQVSEAAAGE